MNSYTRIVSLLLLATAAALAADFSTGQAARVVIGQATFTAQDPASSDTTVGGVSGLAIAGGYLFVADSNRAGAGPSNHRVLLFPMSQFPDPGAELAYSRKCPVCLGQASIVLGRSNFSPFDITLEPLPPATRSSLRLPTSVASDGVHVAIADTDHNRVLIWNSIPQANNAPADVVVGQPNFTSVAIPGNTPNSRSMRGPQGVWISGGKLFVADTQNNRVLVFNSIPTQNGAAADLVLGQRDFTSFVQPDLTQQQTGATANNLLNPVAVTSDGQRLFVTDLGHNRVLIWNSVPGSNGQAADVVIGQPDLTSSTANNAYKTDPNDSTQKQTPVLCTTSNGTDSNGNPTYPAFCNATLSFPRYALSTGDRLFIADGGNDRVLVFNHIPTANGRAANYVIGQLGGDINQASDAADSLKTPMSLAWDGVNLFVSDAYNRRITVYSPGANNVPYTGVRNAASFDIVATGSVAVSGEIQAGDSVTITINGTDYTYHVQTQDSLDTVVDGLVSAIQSSNSGQGDPNVLANADRTSESVLLRARASGTDGNNVTYSAKATPATSAGTAKIAAAAAGTNLSGGGDAAKIAPGTVVSIVGDSLSFQTAVADANANPLPSSLGGTEVYFNGIRAPLFYVSPTQINAQLPWELNDTTSVNAYVRSVRSDGGLVVTTPVAVTIVASNPGIFADAGSSVGVVLHATSNAVAVVSADGSISANDTATVTIADRSYTYTIGASDTLDTVRDALVALINQDPQVTAQASGVFDRIMIKARVQGPEGNGIPIGVSSGTTSGGAQGAGIIMTAINSSTCCSNVAGSRVTADNPAVPGEILTVYATGLGLPQIPDGSIADVSTGAKYADSGVATRPVNSVNSMAGGKTANVLSASVKPGTVGIYDVVVQLNGDLPTDPRTQLTIAQDIYVSNAVTLAVSNPGSSGSSSGSDSSGTSGGGSTTPTPQPQIAVIGNAASYSTAAISPGENIVIFGADLGPGSLELGPITGDGTLSTAVSGVQVLFDGIAAPIVYAMANQTSVMVPYEVNGRTTITMQVVYKGVLSAPVICNVVPAAPGIYTMNSQGFGQGAILNQDGVTVNGPAAPAAKGSVVSIYMTGEGMTSPASLTGAITAVTAGTKSPVAAVSATVGGLPVSIEYAGPAPGMVAGIAQVNVRVPANAPSGSAVPIVISVGGSGTQSGVTLAVQ
jgi:uncharacterized protein (TIGR03437 family)